MKTIDKFKIPINRFFRDYFNYFFAQIAVFGVPIILLPILTRSLSTGDYGLIGLFNSFAQAVSVIGSISLSGAVARAYLDREGDLDFSSYVGNALVINSILVGIASVIFGISFGLIYEISFPNLFIPLAAVFVLSSCVKEILLSLWNVMGRSKAYAILVVSVASANLIACPIFLLFSPDWISRVVPLVVLECICALFAVRYLIRSFEVVFRSSLKYARDLFSFGLPLIPHSLGLLFITAADKLIVSGLFGVEELGIYSVAAASVGLVSLILLPLDKALTPRIYASK